MRIPLEDNVLDIAGKAQRGLNLPPVLLPQTEKEMRQLASKLCLGPDALVSSARKSWYPEDPGPITGLICFNTPFEDFTVNSYLVFDPATNTAAAFDTGADCSGMFKSGLKIQQIFITHIHPDHIQALGPLLHTTGATAYVSRRETLPKAKPFDDAATFRIGRLRVETRRSSGHARGGVTYVITGLQKRLAIVGDAIFAGSMGGGTINYQEALQTSRENILSLPDDTVICPGHGPLTTVGEEKRNNPFFAI